MATKSSLKTLAQKYPTLKASPDFWCNFADALDEIQELRALLTRYRRGHANGTPEGLSLMDCRIYGLCAPLDGRCTLCQETDSILEETPHP